MGSWATVLTADTDLERLFNDPPADATRPCMSLPLTDLSMERDGVSRQLSQARALGVGGVLLRVPPADETIWLHLMLVADTCRRLGMELGVCDFALSTEAPVTSHVQRLVWSAERCAETGAGTNVCSPVLKMDGSYRELARLGVPDVGEILPHQIVDLKTGSLTTNSLWRIYRFGCSDVEPPLPDCFNGDGVFRHVNNLLFACQNRMPRTYGTTLLWCQMTGPGRDDVIWPGDLPEMFLKQSGLNLMKHLPALAGVPVGGEKTAAYVRQQVAQAVCGAWRQRFAQNVDELVHEAGLEAGIDVDGVLVAPEETALYFRRPTLSVARTVMQHAGNVHAAGGARALGRRFVVGKLNCSNVVPTSAQALLPFPYKHEIDRLLSDGATRILLEETGGLPDEGERFSQLRALCRYTHRSQMLLQRGEGVADFLVWSLSLPHALEDYSCDFASQKMLETATFRQGKILFESERTYTRLAVTADALNDRTAKRLVRQIAENGVEVWFVASGIPDEAAVFSKHTSDGKGKVLGALDVGGPLPDLRWETDAAGVQIRFVHRRSSDCEVYYIANVSAIGGPVTCTFRDTGAGEAERWDPVSGETGLDLDATRLADGRLRIPLFMVPHDACFVVFRR